jgi:putative heme-binding domain-containing protein
VNNTNDAHTNIRARVEALWALSQVPRDVIDLKLVDGQESPVADWPLDEVRVVAAGLFQTTQFELKPYGDRHPRKVLDFLTALRKIKPPDDAAAPFPTDFLVAEMVTRYFASPDIQDEYRKTLLSLRLNGNSFGPHADAALITSISFDANREKWSRDNWEIFLADSADDPNKAAHARLMKYLAARLVQPQSIRMASAALRDRNPDIQRVGIQWVGEEKLSTLRKAVESLLADQQFDPRLLMPCLATLSLLDGVPPAEFEKTPPVTQLMKIVADDKRPAALRATALQMVPASTAELSTKLLLEFAKSGDAGLKTQAVRTLQQSGRADGIPLLLEIAADADAETSLRLDAIAGLCATPHDQPLPANIEQLLLDAVNNRLRFRAATDLAQSRLEAIRALRGRATPGTKIGDALAGVRKAASDDRELVEALDLAINGKSSSSDSQLSTLNSQPAPDSGRRVFYHHQGPLCFKCHTVNGRGGNVGPDLSVIARTMNREKLLGSILEPSKEISPQFLTWTITTDDGKTHNGIIVTENGGGDVELGDIQGNITKIPRKSIEERAPSSVSVMPQGLHQRMTPRELSDLLDYLETLK